MLFLVDQAGLGPLPLSAVLTARALGGIAFATGFGAWIDRRTSVRPLLLALAGSSLGYAMLGFTKDFAVLLVIAAIPMAIGAAAFSQSIALVKRHFDHANLYTANRAIGVLRASWSLAWAIGPAIGAVVVGMLGFRGAFFTERRFWRGRTDSPGPCAGEADFRRCGSRPSTQTNERRSGDRARLRRPCLVSYRAVHGINSAGHCGDHVAGRHDERRRTDVQLVRGARNRGHGRAHRRPLRRGERTAIVAGFAVFVAYFVVLALARSVGPVFWAQILRAIAIGLVTYLGIGFLQSLLPHRPGAAAALFSNAGQVGSVVAALGAGALAQAFGYASIFVACAILSAAGLVMICLVRAEPD